MKITPEWTHAPGFGCWRFCCALWVGLALSLAARAETADYSAGLIKFQKLGLPDLHSAQYIQITFSPRNAQRQGVLAGVNTVGNAWLVEAGSNDVARVVLDQLNVVELLPPKMLEERRQKMFARAAAQAAGGASETESERVADSELVADLSRLVGGEWKPADLLADTRKLLKFLNRTNAEDQAEEQAEDHRPENQFEPQAVTCFYFAAHLFSQGRTNEANELVAALFQRINSRKLLSMAMNQIAHAVYIQAWNEFQKNGDWERYLAVMEDLCARFDPVWKESSQVAQVAAQVRRQVQLKMPPEITGEGLAEADRQLARNWLITNAPVTLNHPVFRGIGWLAASPAAPHAASPWDALQQRGLEAIPMLIALLKDEWLVRVSQPAHGGYGMGDIYSGAGFEGLMDREVSLAFRPKSRGELARQILEPLVVSQDLEMRYSGNASISPEDLAPQCQAWYEQHRQCGREELPRRLLSEGRVDVFPFLAKSTNALDRQAVETFLLATNHMVDYFRHAQQYVRAQGPAAKAFVEQYVARLKSAPSLVPSRERQYYSGGSLTQREKQARGELRAMEELVAGKSLESTLQDLLKSTGDEQAFTHACELLEATLSRETPAKALPQILQASLSAPNEEVADYLLNLSVRFGGRARPNPEGAASPALKIEDCARLWSQLLDREEGQRTNRFAAGESEERFGLGLMIEALYGDASQLGGMSHTRSLGSRMAELYTRRARARLAGKSGADLPAFPNPASVSASRKEEIHQNLLTNPQPGAVAAQLTLDELLNVREILEADTHLNARLAPNALLIQNVRCPWASPPVGAFLHAAKGQPFNHAFAESLLAEARKWAAQGSNLVVAARRGEPLAGVTLTASPPATSPWRKRGGKSAKPPQWVQISVMFNAPEAGGGEGLNGYLYWQVKNETAPAAKPPSAPQTPEKEAAKSAPVPPPTLLKSPEDDTLPDDEPGQTEPEAGMAKEFWKAFDQLQSPAANACLPFQFILTIQTESRGGDQGENE